MNIASMPGDEKKNFLDKAVIEFTGNGKFITISNDIKHEGTYVFFPKENTLITQDTTSEDGVQKYTVGWEGDKLMMTSEDGMVKFQRQ